jgi:hypothetical protein
MSSWLYHPLELTKIADSGIEPPTFDPSRKIIHLAIVLMDYKYRSNKNFFIL